VTPAEEKRRDRERQVQEADRQAAERLAAWLGRLPARVLADVRAIVRGQR
jgi:hypothetical protein